MSNLRCSAPRSDDVSLSCRVVRRRHRRRSSTAGSESGNSTMTLKNSSIRSDPRRSYMAYSRRPRHSAVPASSRPSAHLANWSGVASSHRSSDGSAFLSKSPAATSRTLTLAAVSSALCSAASATSDAPPSPPPTARKPPATEASARDHATPMTSSHEGCHAGMGRRRVGSIASSSMTIRSSSSSSESSSSPSPLARLARRENSLSARA